MTPTPNDAERQRFGLTAWMAIVAAIAVEQCGLLLPDQGVWWALAGGCLWTGFAVVVRVGPRWLFGRLLPATARQQLAAALLVGRWGAALGRMLAAAAVMAAAVGTTAAMAPGGGSPEQLLMAIFRGTLLALVATGTTRGEALLAVSITVFLVTFSTIVVEHPGAWAAETIYAIAAAGLLVSNSRRSLSRPHMPLPQRRFAVPRPTQLAACLLVVAVVAWIGRSTDRTGQAFAGFMPLSGGDSWAFPWAHDGVGDGEQLVAATESPEATGPVDSDLFITSEEPSLYDMFNDLYGEPEPPRRQMTPAVALPSESVTEPETKPAESNHAGRQFSTLRRPPRRRQSPDDLAARSLVAVSGPLPVHLRLEVLHSFDGHVWRTDDTPSPATQLVHSGDGWMHWRREQTTGEAAAGHAAAAGRPDHHEVVIGTLRSETLPLPTRTHGLQIDRIEQPSFYEVVDDEVAALRKVAVPASTVIAFESAAGGLDGSTRSLPADLLPALRRPTRSNETHWSQLIFRRWGIETAASDLEPLSWEPAQEVVARLRQEYLLDPEARVPPSCDHAVEHFLTVSRRGPDYLFASAATLLLRELGYTTRLAEGLWISAADRDPLSRRAVADGGSGHLWCEVQTTTGEWIPVEATPHYSLRQPPWTWRSIGQAVAMGFIAMATWLVQPVPSGLLLIMAVVAATWRTLTDRLLTVLWQLALLRRGRCPLRATWRLLEWRAWLAGCPRPPHVTARRWYVAACDEAGGFITAVEERAYGIGRECRAPEDHQQLARAAEAAVSLAALRSGHGRPHRRLWRLPRPRLAAASMPEGFQT